MKTKDSFAIDYSLSQSNQINEMLFVGTSTLGKGFLKSLREIDNLINIAHSETIDKALNNLQNTNYSIIIIDIEDITQPIEFSNLIRINLPISRIVVIAENYDKMLIKELINRGSIDAFIPLPIDTISGYSVLNEQLARFLINMNLYDLITVNPPKFSQSYFLLHNPTLKSEVQEDVQFVGFVIMYSSITKYSIFYNKLLNLDEYLIAGYLSAITLLGEQLFKQDSFFKEINFGPLTLLMRKIDDIQYLFFFAEFPKHANNTLETEMDKMVKFLNDRYYSDFTTEYPISNEIELEVETLVNNFNYKQREIIDYSRPQKLILYGNQLPKLNFIFSKKKDKYDIERFFESDELLNYLINHEADILIINQVLNDNRWNFDIVDQIKDIIPSIQIIALLEELKTQYLLKILNNENIDYVISYRDDWEDIERNLDTAFAEVMKIQKNLLNYHPQDLQYSLHHSVVARSMLRSFTSTFEISNIPTFYGVFILHGDVPYYQKFWPEIDQIEITLDDQLFAGFVSSMEMFTNEIFETQKEFTGFTFGDVTIIIKHQFEFSFIYFLSKIDHTNSIMIDSQLQLFTSLMYQTIVNSEGFFNLDMEEQYDITEILDQQITELIIKLLSLNFN